MSRGIDPNALRVQQEYMRHKGLKKAKAMTADKKRDKKYVLIIVTILVLVLLFLVISELFWK